jgi:hypothetical protein
LGTNFRDKYGYHFKDHYKQFFIILFLKNLEKNEIILVIFNKRDLNKGKRRFRDSPVFFLTLWLKQMKNKLEKCHTPNHLGIFFSEF